MTSLYRVLALTIALAAPARAAVPAAAPRGESPVLVGVDFRSDRSALDTEELEALAVVRIGEPLSREELRRTLRNLHASGRAGEIEAYLQPEGDGVRLILALWAFTNVEEVKLTGSLGLPEAELRKFLPQRSAEPLSESRVIRGVYQLQDHLSEQGFLQAFVRVGVDLDEELGTAVVEYSIESGHAATVGSVGFAASVLPLPESDLRATLRAAPGGPYRPREARLDAERLERWLVERGYRLARVEDPVEVFEAATDQVSLSFPVDVGPLFEVEVVGADVEELLRRGLLPFLGSERYDEALLLESVRALRRHYQERGHYRVEVETSVDRAGSLFRLRIEIVVSEELALARVGFSGNQSFSFERLRELMVTSPRRLLSGGSGRLVDQVLADDLSNLRSFYRLQGFSEVRVGPPEITETEKRLAVLIPIVEGPRQRVAVLRLHGIEQLDPEEVRTDLSLVAGGPFHPRLLDQCLGAVRAYYDERGYQSTQVSAELDWNEDDTLVEVDLRVLEGPRTLVDRVILRGNRRTHTEVVRRAVRLEPAEPIHTGRLLEIQRRLYELGIFTEVDVRLAPASPFSARRDVLVRVEEGKSHRITYGVGYNSEDGARGLLGYSYNNLFGRGISTRFDVRASGRRQQARALLRQPFLGRWNLPVTYSLFGIEERQESFDSSRRGLQIETAQIGGRRELGFLLTYKIVENDTRIVQADNADPVDRDLQEVEIASITPRLLFDRRDDPLAPSRGWSASLQTEYAFPAASAEVEFLKLFGQQTGYVSLGRLGVLGASLRIGAIEALGTGGFEDPTILAELGLASRRIPISERFFAGGRSSHRAYLRDRLAIPCETAFVDLDAKACDVENLSAADPLIPTGGNGLLLLNLDYRFPIFGPVGGTLFADAGNVWADWRDFDPADLRLGAGVGLRYLSPIGPLRFEVGWKLDRAAGEDSAVFFLSFGNPF